MWRPTDPADSTARTARLVTIAATVVFALIVCRFRPWDMFIREAYSNDFYDEQARSFLRFQLAVRPEVPGPEGFLIDGATYLYYGPFLALVRMPFALFGDVFAGRLARASMIAGFATFCTGCFHLVRHLGPSASRWRIAGFVAAAACSPVLFLSGWVSVYHETELWAAALAVWAIVGTMRLLHLHTVTTRQLAAAAFPLAAGILTRASVGLGVAAGASLAIVVAFWSRRSSATAADRNQTAERRAVGTVIGASVAGFAMHAAINWAKFGSPAKLPGQLQLLSLNDPVRAAWFAGNNDSFFSTKFLTTTIVQYLRPDTIRFERLVPFVRYGPLATDRSSYPLETITPSASLTASATLLLGAAILGIVVAVRRRRWTLLALVVGGAIAASPTFTIGFIGNRYLVDMMPLLLVPAALAFATIAMPSHRSLRPTRLTRAARIATVALVTWGAWCNVSLALWTQQLKEPGFTEWRYRTDGWIFGDPAPGLVDLVIGAPVPRDGVVGLAHDDAGACSGVYIAEQGTWVALERANGSLALQGDLTAPTDPAASTPVVGGDDWMIDVAAVGDGIQFSFAPGAEADSEPTFGAVIDAPADGVLRDVTVVVDPIVGQLSVLVGDQLALFHFGAPSGQMVPFAGFTLDADPGDSLCRQLEARR